MILKSKLLYFIRFILIKFTNSKNYEHLRFRLWYQKFLKKKNKDRNQIKHNYLSEFISVENSNSQYGEDGVVAKMFELINVKCKYCIEIGAGDGIDKSVTYKFREEGSKSLLIDGCVIIKNSRDNKTTQGASINDIKNSKHDIKIELVDKENINPIMEKYNVPKNPDLFCIDIDGIDYYIWESLLYEPKICVIKFNMWVDPKLSIALKYNPKWVETLKQKDMAASCFATYKLGVKKGYTLVEIVGDNMIFIKNKYAKLLSIGKELHND